LRQTSVHRGSYVTQYNAMRSAMLLAYCGVAANQGGYTRQDHVSGSCGSPHHFHVHLLVHPNIGLGPTSRALTGSCEGLYMYTRVLQLPCDHNCKRQTRKIFRGFAALQLLSGLCCSAAWWKNSTEAQLMISLAMYWAQP